MAKICVSNCFLSLLVVAVITWQDVSALTCFTCNSSESVFCSRSPWEVKNTALCNEDDVCVTGIFGDYTFRNCLLAISDEFILPTNHVTCSTDKCNNKLVELKNCIVCNSTDDEMCKSQVDYLAPDTCSNEVSFCYTCVRSDGAVFRGCGNNTNEDYNCTYCSDDDCNTGNIMTCYTCNSSSVADCAQWTKPETVGIQKCLNETDMCVTRIVNGSTVRGCNSEVGHCLETNEFCEICTGADCNDGVYPQDRLQCYQCMGKDCVLNPGPLLPCQNFNKDDQCFTHIPYANLGIRGCLSDESSCEDNKFCLSCKTNGCNTQPGLKYYECFMCTSATDPKCKTGHFDDYCYVNVSGKCQQPILAGHEGSDTCYTKYESGVVERNCMDSLKTVENTETCVGDLCNEECVNSIKCYHCSSDNDVDCISDLNLKHLKECPTLSNACYTCTDREGTITRGCGPQQPQYLDCIKCEDEDGCNNKTEGVTKCYDCNSKHDANCVQWADPDKVNIKDCVEGEDERCVMKIDKDGFTIRGCSSDIANCNSAIEICKTCRTNYCNGKVFPPTRQKCHHCADESKAGDCTSSQIIKEPLACRVYDPIDKCLTIVEDHAYTYRGCRSDKVTNQKCEDNFASCFLCATPGCNNLTTDLSCIRCEDNEACPWGFWAHESEKCNTELLFLNSYCFAYENEVGVYVRGCSVDKNTCHETETNCRMCYDNDCNNHNHIYQLCLQCNSTVLKERNCTAYPDTFKPTRCPEKIQPYETRGCYSMREGNHTIRGCVSDLDSTDMDICLNEEDESCISCLDQGCNNQPFSGAFPTRIPLNLCSFSFVAIVYSFIIFKLSNKFS